MRRLVAALVIAAAAAAAFQVAPLAKTSAPAAPRLPATIQGLTVRQEDVSKTLATDRRALYTDGIWLFSLRQGKELMATLEVGHFKSDAPASSADFDLSLADQLGGSVPAVVRLQEAPVYISSTRGLVIANWYHRGYLLILAIRSTYALPKQLLRSVLAVAP